MDTYPFKLPFLFFYFILFFLHFFLIHLFLPHSHKISSLLVLAEELSCWIWIILYALLNVHF